MTIREVRLWTLVTGMWRGGLRGGDLRMETGSGWASMHRFSCNFVIVLFPVIPAWGNSVVWHTHG